MMRQRRSDCPPPRPEPEIDDEAAVREASELMARQSGADAFSNYVANWQANCRCVDFCDCDDTGWTERALDA